MIRAVLAVLVGLALLATATPALADARATTTHDELESMAVGITRTAATLQSGSAAVEHRELAARTTLRLSLPTGFGAAPIETAAVGCPAVVLTDRPGPSSDCTAALVYRIREHEPTVRPLQGVDVRTPNGPVKLFESPVRLRLRYLRVDGAPIIEATRSAPNRTET